MRDQFHGIASGRCRHNSYPTKRFSMVSPAVLKAIQFSLLPFVLLLAAWANSIAAAPGLPESFDPDPDIRSPEEFFGFAPGDRHPRHDQIAAYMEYLAEVSDRVSIEQIGQTHELRPLQLLAFASPERQAELDALRADRVRASRAGEGPAVVWLGYAVHGNEASAATAAVVTAWYLAAARGEEVQSWLDELVIVMEPVLNPDGLDRFAHWVNMHRGHHPSADPADREHHEAWPRGRTNAYWFDLNRDWLPLVHPESQARIRHYHQWRPHVLTDHHEMGPNSSYFFQPGVPERNNPLTPERNYELTARIAEYHGAILDAADEPFYTRETFDDYYVGKGSTYPDLTGGIGILFEQGSARGHVQDTDYGRRTFADAVANQVRTSLSTVQGAHALADELIAYQAEFFDQARREGARTRQSGWLVGDGGDPLRAQALLNLLFQHDVTLLPVTEAVTIDGRRQDAGTAWAIPAEQDQYRFLRSVLDPVLDLPMETFYDVSTWPLSMSWGLPVEPVRRLPAVGDALQAPPAVDVPAVADQALAWLVPWNQRGAAPLLAALLAEGYRVQTLTKPTRVSVSDGDERNLVRGSLIVHRGLQDDQAAGLQQRLTELSDQFKAEILATERGLVASGADLGSPSAPVLDPVKPALLVGEGLRATHAGYIWHWFDRYLEQPLTQLDWQRLRAVQLSDYSHLILPDGSYGRLPDSAVEQLRQFVLDGGVLIAARRAAAWVENLELDWDFVEENGSPGDEQESGPERRAYADFRQDRARRLIGGSALAVDLDVTHPLAFGYERSDLVVMRRGHHRLRAAQNPYSHVAVYSDEVLASGFLSDDNRQRLAGTPALSGTRHGRGAVVRMADDYLFRGYWLGTERLFANALFFSRLVGPTRLPED
ncbi:MAG: peptidase M14 [Wenzhouxiangella sp.]|nr:MAG: peptidase M14 [Wenzhouxiangella sp.]